MKNTGNFFNIYFLYLLKSKNKYFFRYNTTHVRVGAGSGAGAERNIFGISYQP
jgi:hypothetical protein